MNTPKQTFPERTNTVLHNSPAYDKILSVKDGWLSCPRCRRNHRVLKILPNTFARNLRVYCRDCKWERRVDIEKGQCFESRGQ